MRASIVTMENNTWSNPIQLVKGQTLSSVANSQKTTAILNVFDSELSLKAFANKLSEIFNVPFSVKELTTKKGECYFRILINPSFSDNNVEF